ncbi:MAG: LptF/LptG family permease [Nitrospinae bacterium]|nr:LptF/LptG family permease [Nitrospinota bacterium]
MKILDRYIFTEMAKVFVLGLFILMAVLVLEKINFISNMALGGTLGAGELFRLILYTSPAFLIISIPLAVLLASLITFSRMSADNEVIAMRAGGMSFPRSLAPVALISGMCAAVSLWLALGYLHQGNYLFNSQITGFISKRIASAVGEKVFFDRFPDTVIYVNQKPQDKDAMKGLFIYDGSSGDSRFITAEDGVLTTTRTDEVLLRLRHGAIYAGGESSWRLIRFESYEMLMDTGKRTAFIKGAREMSVPEIAAHIRQNRAGGEAVNADKVEMYKRFSLPLACLALGLLGAPLGVRVHRGGRWGGIGMGIVLIVANYLLLMVGESMGRQGKLHPALAMFLPDIIMGALAVFFICRISREAAPFGFMDSMGNLWRAATRRYRGGR